MLFNILSELSKKSGILHLEILDSFFKPLSPKSAFSTSQLQEREILKNLKTVKEGSSFYTASLKDINPLLRSIAALGTLYIDKEKVIPDFFSKIDLHYRVSHEKGSIKIEAFVFLGKEVRLESLDFIFAHSPAFFFKKPFLKMFHPDLDSIWIRRALKEPIVEKEFYTKWIKESANFPESLPLIKEESISLIEPTKTPEIMMRDSQGIFVDFFILQGEKRTNFFDLPLPLSQDIQDYEKDLLEVGYSKRPSERHYICPGESSLEALELLLSIGWSVTDKRGSPLRLLKDALLTFELNCEKILVEEKNSSLYIEQAFQGKHLVPFHDGTLGLLPKGFLTQCASLAQDIEEENGSFFIPKCKAGALLTNDLFKDSLSPSLQSVKERLLTRKNIPLIKKEFQGTLRPYQEEGTLWLRSLYDLGFHGILADEMGLGKTIQVIALLSSLEKKSPHLIIMPKSLLFNWKQEFKRFLPEFNVHIHSGTDREKDAKTLRKFDAILTSYPLLRQDIDLFKTIEYQSVVLDEAQYIKNASTKISLAVKELSSLFRLSITGTPVENSIEDLLGQFSFLMPKLLKKDLFKNSLDPEDLKNLKKKIRPFLLCRKKHEVAKDLPEKIDQTLFVSMDEKEREEYYELQSSLRERTLSQVRSLGLAKSRFLVFETILRLRQYACHPLLINPQLENKESAKFTLLLEELKEAVLSGSKVIVFSQFTQMLDIMEKSISLLQLPYVRLDGKTKNREEVVREFQEKIGPLIFLMSLKAGGVGLNLEAADSVFLYEPWWNEAVEEQAIARAHRIGRKSTVIAKRYITVGTIEEKIEELKKRKSALSSLLLEDSESPASLSLEDIEFLLEE